MEKASNNLKISIIVPIYNTEKYLDRCLNSIINQTYKNIEIILVDDESTDKSPIICDEYEKKDSRIKVIHKKNAGVSAARNIGIENATGVYITFIDSDDWIELDFLQKMYEIIIKSNGDYVTCGYKRVYNDHTEFINSNKEVKIISQEEYIKLLLNVQNGYGFAHMKLIKKDKIKNIRFNEKLKVGEDALYNIQLCKNIKKVIIYNEALYNYFFNTNSVVRKYDENYANKYLISMKTMKYYINANYKNNGIEQNLYNYIAYHVLLICVNYCFHPKNNNGGKQSLAQVCNEPLFKEAIEKSNFSNLSITRKVSLFVLKNKWYNIMAIICKIRQKQFKSKKGETK